MLRESLVVFALVSPLWAQTGDAPLQIMPRIASIDWPIKAGQNVLATGVAFDIRNSSLKNVRAYALKIKWISAARSVSRHWCGSRTRRSADSRSAIS